MLQEAPAWKGVLGHNQFDGQVVIKKHPPFDAALGADWTDHAEWQVRKWFQLKDINPTIGDVGRAVQDAARHHPFHPVRDYLNEQIWDGSPPAIRVADILRCRRYRVHASHWTAMAHSSCRSHL